MNFNSLLNNPDFMNFINELFNKGLSISIQDEIAWKSILTTAFFTSVFTGIITYMATSKANRSATETTLKLFEEQENIRIKNELRLNFYNEYKILFDKLSKLITELISNLKSWTSFFATDDNGNIISPLEIINSPEDIIDLCDNIHFHNCIELINNLLSSFDILKDFMEKNEKISGYNEFKYLKEYRFINSIIYEINHINARNLICIEYLNNRIELNQDQINNNINKFKEVYSLLSILSSINSKNNRFEFNNFDEFKKSFYSKHDEINNDFILKYFDK